MSIKDMNKVPAELPVTGGKIAFVGEAPGAEEAIEQRPFVGPAGVELNYMLRDAGIIRSECLITNVFDYKLPANKVESICGRKKEMPKDYDYPPIAPGNYLRPEYLDCLDRLRQELELAKPNVIVPLGNTALWAVCRLTGIKKFRGRVTWCKLIPGAKVIPTYHPAYILRNWSDRVLVLADLLKIKRESRTPDIVRVSREVWIEPTIGDLYEFERLHKNTKLWAPDIETTPKGNGQIRCVGFAPDPYHAIVVPFVDLRREDYSYWPSADEELAAWDWCERMLGSPIAKLFQNGLYDMFWLFRKPHIRTLAALEDLLLMHHAMQPELAKSLDMLGSIYTDEIAWKTMRPRGKGTDKRDE